MENVNPILQFVLGTGFATVVSALVVYFSNKGKNSAETEQIATNVYKGLNTDLLQQLKDSRLESAQLRTDIKGLSERLNQMEERDEEKERELIIKNARIIELERRVSELEEQLKHASEKVSQAVDTFTSKAAEAGDIIKNITSTN